MPVRQLYARVNLIPLVGWTKNVATGELYDAGERPDGAVHGEEPEAGPPLQVRGVRHQQGGRVPPHPDQGPRQGGEPLQ